MNPTTLLRTLKGPPISILMALLFHPTTGLGVHRLARLTGYTDKPVSQALQLLADLQLAQNHGRYNGWTATAYIRQLILGELPPDSSSNHAPIETESFRLPTSSSSSNGQLPFRPGDSQPTTTTTTPETEILRLPEPWDNLVALLIQRCTTPPNPARKAIRAAMDRNDDPDHTRYSILRWLSYCTSDDGASLNNPGAYIATRITQAIDCPDWHHPELGTDLDNEIRTLEWKLWPES